MSPLAAVLLITGTASSIDRVQVQLHGVAFSNDDTRRDYLNRAYALGKGFAES